MEQLYKHEKQHKTHRVKIKNKALSYNQELNIFIHVKAIFFLARKKYFYL